LDSVGLDDFGRVRGRGFLGFRVEIGEFGGAFAAGCDESEGSGDMVEVCGGVEIGGDLDERADGVAGLPAPDVEPGAGVPFGEISGRDGAAFEEGFDPRPEARERHEPTDQGVRLRAVLKPEIGLGTELARAAGDASGALH